MAINLKIRKIKASFDFGNWIYEGVGVGPIRTFFNADSDFPNLIGQFQFNVIDINHDKSALLASINVGDPIALTGNSGESNYVVLAISLNVDVYIISVYNTLASSQLVEGDTYRMRPGKEVGYIRADLYTDEGAILKRQLLSDTGIDNTARQYSKDFNIPATPQNNELLHHWELKSNESIVNPNKAISAQIDINEVQTIQGSIELLSVTWKNNKPESYKIVFYGDVSDFKADLGNILLSEINWSEFEFIWSQGAVTNSWNSQTENYFIPIISFKRWFKWFDQPVGDTTDIATEETGVLLTELRVGLRLLDMIEAIAASIGKTIVFDSEINEFLEEVFIIPSRFKDQALTFATALYLTEVTNDIALPIPDQPPSVPPQLNEIIVMNTILFDPRNGWDSISTYTAEFTGIYSFELLIIGSERSKYDCWLYESVGNTAIATASTATVQAGDVASMVLQTGLTAGVDYYFVWECSANNNLGTPTMKTITVPVSIIGTTYDPSTNMPVLKASEFIGDFLKAFNLMLYQSNINEFTIIDTTRLFEVGDVPFDLQDYVDEQSLTYEKLQVYDNITFRHTPTEAAPNDAYIQINGKDYGEVDFLPDIDFSSGKLDHESIFTVFPPAYIYTFDSQGEVSGRTDLWHHYQLSSDPEPKPVLADFLLMYRNAPVSTAFEWWLQDGMDTSGDPTFTLQPFWGRYSQVQQEVSSEGTSTLSYSREAPFAGVPAENTITNAFWSRWLLQLYKRTAYTLEIAFPANFGVFLKISAINTVYLNGFYHYIAGWEYDSAKDVIKLELLRADSGLILQAEEKNGTLKIYNI